MLSCAFDRRGCTHETLFLNEYKRTNRTKGTKILRCFPHCCPEHVNRSYCGTALHVRVQSRTPTDLALDRLLVFAHFEEVGARTFGVDDELPSHAVFQSLQSEQNPKGEWIQGHALEAVNHATIVFQINPGARWYYEWESAATKAQRFTKHVLKVYVLAQDRRGEFLRVVASATSSEFMVVSYRRAPTDVAGDRRLLALLAENVVRHSGELGLEPDGLLASLGHKMLPFLVDSQTKEDKNSVASPTDPVHISPTRGRRRPHPASHEHSIEDHHVWAAKHQDILTMSKRLAVLYSFLSAVPAVDFQDRLSDWRASIGSPGAETKVDPSPSPQRFYSVSWQFLSAPELHSSSLWDQGRGSPHHDVDALVTQSIQVLSWLLTDESNQRTFTQLLHESARVVLDRAALRNLYLHAVSTLHGLIDQFLATRFGSSFRQFHEDMVAMLFRIDVFRSLRSDLLAQLSSTDMAGFQTFVSQARQGLVVETRHSLKRKRSQLDASPSHRWMPPSVSSLFVGTWCMDSQQCSIIPLTHAPPLAFSVGGAVEVMRELTTVSITLNDIMTSMDIRSSWALGPSRGMQLVLDSKKRVFDAYPSGMASTIPWNGLTWGDYRAQLVSADCIMLEFLAWPQMGAQDAVLRWKVCLRPSQLDASPRAWALTVDGVVEQGRCEREQDFVTLPIAHRRAAASAWTPVYQLKALYMPV